VVLYDTSPEALKSATTYVADTLSSYCSIQGTHPGKIHFTTSLTDACTNPWMCIEAVPEILELKISILGRLDRTVPTDCIIATNSSSFPSAQLISEVAHRERVLNTLYYIPPDNKCVELMPNPYTSPLLPPFLTTQLLNINLSPITIPKPSSGLIFPRLFSALKREALALLADGTAKPEEIDELFRDFFSAKKGVCEKMDEVGLDTVLAVERHFAEVERERRDNGEVRWDEEPSELKWLEREFVSQGRIGNKCEQGGLLTKGWVVGEEKKEEKAGVERWKEHAVDLSGL
jgi:3-hydroxyacyl-CoA dehydrogenase